MYACVPALQQRHLTSTTTCERSAVAGPGGQLVGEESASDAASWNRATLTGAEQGASKRCSSSCLTAMLQPWGHILLGLHEQRLHRVFSAEHALCLHRWHPQSDKPSMHEQASYKVDTPIMQNESLRELPAIMSKHKLPRRLRRRGRTAICHGP